MAAVNIKYDTCYPFAEPESLEDHYLLLVMDLFLFNFLYESVASLQVMYTVLTVEPIEYLEYKIKDAINFL